MDFIQKCFKINSLETLRIVNGERKAYPSHGARKMKSTSTIINQTHISHQLQRTTQHGLRIQAESVHNVAEDYETSRRKHIGRGALYDS